MESPSLFEHDDDSPGNEHDSPGPKRPLPRIDTPTVLFSTKRTRRHELWQFIKLSARSDHHSIPRDQLVNKDAEFAYCYKCHCSISFESGRHQVRQHIKAYHERALEEYESPRKPRSRSLGGQLEECDPRAKRKMRRTSDVQQKTIDAGFAKWVATNHRAISTVEDSGFLEVMRDIEEAAGFKINVPKWTKLRTEIDNQAHSKRKALKKEISIGCVFFSATTDMQTERAVRGYISFTIHYLDASFNMHAKTLEVDHCPGKHDG